MSVVSNCLTVVVIGEARTPFLRKDLCRELSAPLLQIVSLCCRLRLRDHCPYCHAGSTDQNSEGRQCGDACRQTQKLSAGKFHFGTFRSHHSITSSAMASTPGG